MSNFANLFICLFFLRPLHKEKAQICKNGLNVEYIPLLNDDLFYLFDKTFDLGHIFCYFNCLFICSFEIDGLSNFCCTLRGKKALSLSFLII